MAAARPEAGGGLEVALEIAKDITREVSREGGGVTGVTGSQLTASSVPTQTQEAAADDQDLDKNKAERKARKLERKARKDALLAEARKKGNAKVGRSSTKPNPTKETSDEAFTKIVGEIMLQGSWADQVEEAMQEGKQEEEEMDIGIAPGGVNLTADCMASST